MLHYYIFYKPFQVLCQFSPEGEKKTLSDFLPKISKNIYPVGRLDYDSEGLLLLTNDKPLTHRLLEPKYKHPRTYWVQVEGIPTQEAIAQLQSGVSINIDGTAYKTLPAKASLFTDDPIVPERNPPIRYRKNIPATWLSLTLTEGKNRQVRRMTAAVGYPTLRLIRHSIGNISIEEMQPAEIKELTPDRVQQLFVVS
jgi:23S rRNA pseudouridine2457 synthase